MLGVFTRGHILGFDEATIGKSEIYTTTAICKSQTVRMIRIETKTFKSLLKPTLAWHDLSLFSINSVKVVG